MRHLDTGAVIYEVQSKGNKTFLVALPYKDEYLEFMDLLALLAFLEAYQSLDAA